ncbi:MAG TPA: efflux RND transporter periplasmic adaptor subunit [Rhodocyclaceae bacterium]
MKRTLLACLIPLALAACGGDAKGPGAPGGPGAMPPPEVDVIGVAPGKATLTQDLPGRVQAIRSAQVRARVEAIVEKRLFVEGGEVKAGTPLFQLDDRTYRANADSAKADVAVAKQNLERYKPLLEVRAVSRQEYDLAESKLKQAEAALAKAQLDLENARVQAPISGRIGRALVTEGALVGKADATHLATIEQLDPLYVNFTQSTSELLRLRQGIGKGALKKSESVKVELLLEDGSIYAQSGKLLFTDLAVDPNTGALNLRAEFPNPKRELLPGMFVRVRFPEAEADNVIRVPQRAVQANPQGQFVMVVDAEGKAAPRPVKTGGMSGGDWIIADGLKGGEQVIVNGLQKARPGSPVKAVPWNPAAAAQAQAAMAAPTDKAAAPAASAATDKPAAPAPAAKPAEPAAPATGAVTEKKAN